MKDEGVKRSEDIHANVVFIKISRLYDECIGSDGKADVSRVRDCVRAAWKMGDKCEETQYIFAVHQGVVVDVCRITAVHGRMDAEARNGLPDYPNFPPYTRKMDRLAAKVPSLSWAKANLSSKDFADLCTWLNKSDLEKALRSVHRRRYFSVDGNVPAQIQQFVGYNLSRDGVIGYPFGQQPVQYNF